MRYADAKKKIAGHRKILVVGPQRSGTKITSKAISEDFGFKNYIERDNEELIARFQYLIDNDESFVLQAPFLTPFVQEFNKVEGLLVVFMLRDLKDVRASEDKVELESPGWIEANSVIYGSKYEMVVKRNGFDYEIDYTKPICEIQMEVWEKFQKRLVKDFIEIEYESLSEHPIWIDKKERAGFTAGQMSARKRVKYRYLKKMVLDKEVLLVTGGKYSGREKLLKKLKKELVEHELIKATNYEDLVEKLNTNKKDKIIIDAVDIDPYLIMISSEFQVSIVYLFRDLSEEVEEEILFKSKYPTKWERIFKKYAAYYQEASSNDKLGFRFTTDMFLSEVARDFWEHFQRPFIEDYVEVEYDFL